MRLQKPAVLWMENSQESVEALNRSQVSGGAYKHQAFCFALPVALTVIARLDHKELKADTSPQERKEVKQQRKEHSWQLAEGAHYFPRLKATG